ncbi:hypothetical protein [Arsukibacterium indicum]|uniref:Uncharacterized protein n=1 Tax=Arsukibacterium indicum TaxID=2848612 RepID=A0ABS6MIH9_9GAMM|nr:hypothetical protein [Arsukibacterium indicum]MBV2128179.1 hypothetical protein [Arsukibacterium indicum]
MNKPNPALIRGCPAEVRRYIADLEQQVKTADERTIAAIQYERSIRHHPDVAAFKAQLEGLTAEQIKKLRQSMLKKAEAMQAESQKRHAKRQDERQQRINHALRAMKNATPCTRVLVADDILDDVIQQHAAITALEQAETQRQVVTIMASDAYGEEKHRQPVTSLDWELLQAINHLQNAISVTDSKRGHLLQAAMMIAKGVRESE